MKLRKLIRSYLGFSKTEANGMIIMIPLMIFFLFTPYLYRQFFGTKYNTQEEDKRLLDSLVAQIDAGFQKEESEPLPIEYFKFDPNDLSVTGLESMGIPKFLASRIDNYRNKGGKFKIKKDLSKIFDFPDSLYSKLEPYIDLPGVLESNVSKKAATKHETKASKKVAVATPEPVLEENNIKFDINMADTALFKTLRGIGSVYAGRIVKYRQALGGYHSLSQLEEVYGMTEQLYQQIIPFLEISDSLNLNKISINLAPFKELLAHPYINYEQTREILNVKSKHGKFKKAEDLSRLKLMDSTNIKRLLPYILF